MSGLKAAIGGRPAGARLERMQASAQWRDGRFVDVMKREEPRGWSALREWITGGSPHRVPEAPLPVLPRTAEDFATPPDSGLRVTWLGHSSSLVEIDGQRVLFDPVFGERASPVSWAGPKRFHPPPLPVAALPAIDVVAISHDHYDHLDYPTIRELAATGVHFVVPLGVGAHLEHWGIAPERVTELDWWEIHQVGTLELVATPARHFSGRSPTMSDRDRTLWAGWALLGSSQRIYFSGDTAMFPGLSEIGQKLGPFDLALIESGAYNPLWRDVHIGPEQAVLACRMVKSELLLPVHWATFDLALHAWTEPIERILAAAQRERLRVVTPRPGASLEPAAPPPVDRWWPEVPWQRARELGVISSGLDDALEQRIRALSLPSAP